MTEKKPDDKEREEHQKIIEAKPFDFIERTKPEDRIDGDVDRPTGRGQLTRDNVNPAIPSAKPGEGDIVDPKRLGMESQAGEAPPARNEPEAKNITAAGLMESINEPPGSHTQPAELEQKQAQTQPAPATKPVTTRHETDPDELEDEIDAAEDDDDVDVKHGGKPKTKKR